MIEESDQCLYCREPVDSTALLIRRQHDGGIVGFVCRRHTIEELLDDHHRRFDVRIRYHAEGRLF